MNYELWSHIFILLHFYFFVKLNFLEATTGIEPMNNGFADHRLTTWLRGPNQLTINNQFYFNSFLIKILFAENLRLKNVNFSIFF